MGFVLESPLPRTGRGRLVPGVVLVVLVGLALSGYRVSRPNLDPDTTSRTAAGVTVLVYTEDFEGAVSAVGHAGTLAVVGSRCLGLRGDSGGRLLVFPRGTAVRAEGGEVAVRVPASEDFPAVTLGPGDPIDFGLVDAAPVPDFGGHLVERAPRACRRLGALGLTEVSGS